MNRVSVIALSAAGWVSMATAAVVPEAGRIALEQLRTERQAAVVHVSRTRASKPQIDLKPLLGVGRGELLKALGAPDFCALPVDTSCMQSARLVYFFYPRKPVAPRNTDNGLVEVTVTAGGEWALELNVARDSVVQASWVKQE